ncbi:MAG: hypothetical protein ACI92E_001760 [Oceanicoccus sp.]|jgi:hypothetical protein
MSEKNVIDLNLMELVNMAANVLDQLFINAPKDKAKLTFKNMKSGSKQPLGKITINNLIEAPVNISLDYSEFRGPGFNFDVFIAALRSILNQLAEKFRAKAELNILSSDDNTQLIHLPGIVNINNQFNVMVLAIELGTLDKITISLMFVDPGQYEALNPKDTTVS